jgi:non-ribosomal peptide synthetase component F/ubiquinone/menaquinone biosynthesis C-methylase UbiE
MLEEVLDRFRGALAGTPRELPPVPSTYRDFVGAEHAAMADPRAREFWGAALRDALPTPLFGRDREPGFVASRTIRFELDLPVELAAQLREVARAEELPLKSLLVAAHLMALGVAGGEDEILTGLIVNARLEEPGADEVVGVFLNTVPLWIDLDGADPVELARRVVAWERACAPYRRYPFGSIQRDLGHNSPLGRLQSYVNFMDFQRDRYHRGALGVGVSIAVADTNYPVAVDFLVEPTGRLVGWLDCDVEALPERDCERLAGYHTRALAAVAAGPHRPLAETDLLDAHERHELAGLHGPVIEYDRTATVHGLFTAQVARTPNARAVSHHWDDLTYSQLDAAAHRIARALVAAGVRPGDLVGVSVRRSIGLVIALLGVLEAGAAYVPLDPTFPLPRLRAIAEDAQISYLLTAEGTPEELTAAVTCPVVDLDARSAELAALPDSAPEGITAAAEDRAYVMYTSGSTGRPKGAQVSHRNVVSFFTGMDDRIGCGTDDVVLAVTSACFDISVLELIWPLTRGAQVVIAGERIIHNLVRSDPVADATGNALGDLADAGVDEIAAAPHTLVDLCRRHGVTLLQGTPSLLSAVVTEPEALAALSDARALLVGGEVFASGLADRLMKALPGVRLLNMYGPTETTIWSTAHELDPAAAWTAAPIGTPIANTLVRVLDSHGRDVPAGVVGELWIGGDGVAGGYLRRPELTAERFVTLDGSPYYRTGDRVRRGVDGVLQFLGRTDRQVKIHGHRVEPDEVESVLSRHVDVDAVAVVPMTTATGTELVAYVAPAQTRAGEGAEQAHVRRWAEVWRETYRPDDVPSGEFAGWTSSFTGEPIPAGQMREWLGYTVGRIAGYGPGAVADIGVGVGLVLRGLVDRTTEYHGVDISPEALAAAARCLGDRPLPDHVKLVRGGPEYLEGLPDNSLDAVVFNSVVQYFPRLRYLGRVLTEAARVVRPGGVVFVGDVRSVAALQEFHTAVAVHRAPPMRPVEEVRAAVARHVREEPELCLAPAFFRRLAQGLPAIGEVRAEVKRGRADNELTAFRYDLTLHIGPPPAAVAVERVAWEDIAGTGLPAALASRIGAVLVTGIPNRRVLRHAERVRLLAGLPEGATVWDLERLLWEVDNNTATHPEDLVDIADRTGRTVRTMVRDDGSLRCVDALFTGTEDRS